MPLAGGSGHKPFAEFNKRVALADLRQLLALLGVPEASKFRTQDLRRGHARDLQSSGATLSQLTAAGQWAPAWTRYVDMDTLEDEAVAEAKLFKRAQGPKVVPDTGDDKASLEELVDMWSECSSDGELELG